MLGLTKDISIPELSVKDIDGKQGIVSGYFASFGNKDSDGDIIVKGAFKKTLAEKRDRIQHLFNHNTDALIGRVMEIYEDEKGLGFTSKMSKTDVGQRALAYYEEGILREHSIGFSVIRYEIDNDAKATKLTELRLYEGSAVTWGANEMTPVTGIKAVDPILKVHDLLEKLQKCLTNPIVSDHNGKAIESIIAKIKSLLSTQQQDAPEIPPVEPKVAPDDIVKSIRSILTFDNKNGRSNEAFDA